MPMTLEEFRASKKCVPAEEFCKVIGVDRDHISADHVFAYGPDHALYIEDRVPEAQDQYYLILGRSQFLNADLSSLEVLLYEWAADEDCL